MSKTGDRWPRLYGQSVWAGVIDNEGLRWTEYGPAFACLSRVVTVAEGPDGVTVAVVEGLDTGVTATAENGPGALALVVERADGKVGPYGWACVHDHLAMFVSCPDCVAFEEAFQAGHPKKVPVPGHVPGQIRDGQFRLEMLMDRYDGPQPTNKLTSEGVRSWLDGGMGQDYADPPMLRGIQKADFRWVDPNWRPPIQSCPRNPERVAAFGRLPARLRDAVIKELIESIRKNRKEN